MREVDAETPVIWPSWCYSGTAGGGADQGGGPVGGLAARARAPRRRAGPPAHANGAALALDASAAHNNNNNNIGSPLHAAGIKSERLSPHNTPDRSSSRSRSVTPSTCSYPGTPPQGAAERGPSPAHPNPNHVGQMQLGQTGPMGPLGQTGLGQGQSQPPHVLARNYSDFMRNLAAKYNNANPNGSIFGVPRPLSNGLDPLGLKAPALLPPHPAHHAPAPATTPAPPPTPATPVGGMFAGYSFSHGGPRTVPAFPSMMDMSSTKALLAIARVANAAKEADMSSHFKGVKRSPGHNDSHPLSSPLDLSSAASALTPSAKKPRPSPKHEPLPESTSPSGWNNYADGRERSPGIESSQCFSLSIKSESRNGCSEGSKYEKAQSQCGSVKSEAASPASSGRKSPGSTGRKSPGSSTGRECGGCCRGEMKRECSASAHSEVAAWSVDDVCKFVESIDICAEYSTMFREQRIDGAGLPLLTEDHLTGLLRMKLGPALKLRALLSSRLGSCAHCRAVPPVPAPAASGPWKSPAPASPVPKSERPPSANSEES